MALRNGTGKNQPIAQALKHISPLYKSNYIKMNLVYLLQTKPIMFVSGVGQMNQLITEIPADVCTNYHVSNIPDIGPYWMSIALNNKSVLFKELNQLITERMIRRLGTNTSVALRLPSHSEFICFLALIFKLKINLKRSYM
jgi:hypothetical protein